MATNKILNDDMQRILEARHHDPFAVLGRHPLEEGIVVRAFLPHAVEVAIAEGELPLQRIAETDFFEWRGDVFRLSEGIWIYTGLAKASTGTPTVFWDPIYGR
jgi:hypothetical protein